MKKLVAMALTVATVAAMATTAFAGEDELLQLEMAMGNLTGYTNTEDMEEVVNTLPSVSKMYMDKLTTGVDKIERAGYEFDSDNDFVNSYIVYRAYQELNKVEDLNELDEETEEEVKEFILWVAEEGTTLLMDPTEIIDSTAFFTMATLVGTMG